MAETKKAPAKKTTTAKKPVAKKSSSSTETKKVEEKKPEFKIPEVTPVMLACETVGISWEALNDSTQRKLDSVAKTLDELGKLFSPDVLETIVGFLAFTSANEIVGVTTVDKLLNGEK